MQHLLERAQRGETYAQTLVLDSIKSRVEKMAAYFGRRCGVDEDVRTQPAPGGRVERCRTQGVVQHARVAVDRGQRRRRAHKSVHLDLVELGRAESEHARRGGGICRKRCESLEHALALRRQLRKRERFQPERRDSPSGPLGLGGGKQDEQVS